MKSRFLAVGLMITLGSLSANAQTPPRVQTQAFALAFTLRMCDLRAQGFVQSVKALKDVDNDGAAGAEVAHLSKRAVNLRRRQAAAYTRIAWLLDQMDAPSSLRHWSAQTATSLASPLAYSNEAKPLVKTEPDTAATLAELEEVQAVKMQADARQPSLSAWLKLTGGRLAVWTAEVGSYAADLHIARQSAAHDTLSPSVARHLLLNAPPDAPSEVRGDLSELIPRGGGNLQNLATIAPRNVSPEKMAQVSEKLTAAYDASKLTDTVD